MRAPGVKPYREGATCYFGHQHSWSTALAAALNSNEGAELPLKPEWVFWCATCGMVAPWEVER